MSDNKPIFSLMYFEAGKGRDCGAAWDYGRASGSLNVAIDLSRIPSEQPIVRLKVFPTAIIERAKVLEGYLKQILEKIEATKADSKLPPKAPFFDCLVKHGEGWVNVGSLWNNSQNGNLDFQLKLKEIPQELVLNKKLNALLVPNKKYFPRASGSEGLGVASELSGGES